jgi:hypothetical protein
VYSIGVPRRPRGLKTPPPNRTSCAWCGVDMSAGSSRWCSDACRYAQRDATRRGPIINAAVCGNCGAEFAHLRVTKARRYCFACVPAAPVRESRKCASCGAPALSQRHRYCEPCQRWAYARRRKREGRREHKGTTKSRGYGGPHQRLRRRIAKRVEAGEVHCARCGGWIAPGTPWDLGHDDHDRSKYTGAEHARCNRATAGRPKAGRKSRRTGRQQVSGRW